MLDVIGYVLLGLFLLFVPGFLFSLVLYPKLKSLDFWTRAGMSLALGVMLLIYVGYALARPEWRMLQLTPFIGVTLGLSVVLAILAYLRGGFEVIIAYTRAVTGILKKLRPPKAHLPSIPPKLEQHEQPPEKSPEQGGEAG